MKKINLQSLLAAVSLLCFLLAGIAIYAKPAPEKPQPPLDLTGRWEGHAGRKVYDVNVFDQQGVTVAYWRDSDGWLSYVGVLTKNTDGTWTETYAESEALNRCGPWQWHRDEAGTTLIDTHDSWRLIRPQAAPPPPDPDFTAVKRGG